MGGDRIKGKREGGDEGVVEGKALSGKRSTLNPFFFVREVRFKKNRHGNTTLRPSLGHYEAFFWCKEKRVEATTTTGGGNIENAGARYRGGKTRD